MKKISVLSIVLLLSFCSVFAADKSKDNKENYFNTETVAYNRLATVQLSVDEITLPLEIKVPAPSETIIGINGPCRPNITNWKVEGDYLIITYTQFGDIAELTVPGVYLIEVATNPMKYYVIELVVTN